MIYEVQFYRWSGKPHSYEIIRRYSGEFTDLDSAKLFGFANTGPKDSPNEADGFLVAQDGTVISQTIIKLQTQPDA